MATRRFVIAHHNEDLSWTQDLPEKEIFIYCKGTPLGNNRTLPNVGREAHTYLSFIIENYSNLPDVTVFSQGHIRDHTTDPNPSNYLCKLATEALENGLSKNFCRTIISGRFNILQAKELNSKYKVPHPDKIAFEDWFAANFQIPYPCRACCISYGAIFAMRKDCIVSRSKAFYIKLLDQLTYDNAPIEAHFLERSWYYIPVQSFVNVDFYSICLMNKPERVHLVHQVKEAIPQLNVIEAIDAAKLTKEYIAELKEQDFFVKRRNKYIDSFGRYYQLGGLGCFLSHKKVLQTIQQQRKPYAVVFEDDVILQSSFHEKIYNLFEHIHTKNLDFDIINLHTLPFQRFKYNQNAILSCEKAQVGLCGTQCYLVKKSNISKILNLLDKYSDPIDEQLSRSTSINYLHLIGVQPLIEQKGIPSYIQNEAKLCI